MNKLWIPALIATATFSVNALADHRWDDDDHCEHRHRHGRHMERMVMQPVYMEPPIVYQAPPQVIYRDRVVYRDRPVYYDDDAEPRYQAPPPRHYEPRVQSYPAYGGNRVVGQAIGAVAGGVIGNQFGKGSGRVAATAVGAVVGSVVGGNIAAAYGY